MTAEEHKPPARRSRLGWSVLIGAATLAAVGAVFYHPPDFTPITGAIYGLFLGAVVGVILDRVT